MIRETIPPDEIQMVINNIGIPGGGVNLAFSDTSILSGADGEILVALNPEKHAPTPSYIERLRTILPQRFPDLVFFFQPADMVAQILNFGLPAPIDVQVIGRDPKNVDVARDLVRRIAAIPGAVDVRLQPGRRHTHDRHRCRSPAGEAARLHRARRRLDCLSLSGIARSPRATGSISRTA